MSLRSKLKHLYKMSGKDRLLLVEAAFFLGVARLLILLVPFRLIAPWLARSPRNLTERSDPLLKLHIRRAVVTAARNVPWNAVCLPQAIAAKFMLGRRGFPSTLHLGVRRKEEGSLTAHAWLEAGSMIVVGGEGKDAVTPIAHFG